VFFLSQIPELGNACGTIAIIHSFINNFDLLGFESESVIGKFLERMKGKTPQEKGIALNLDDEINLLHNQLSAEGQTEVVDGKVDYHFVCFTAVNGKLYELDGTKPIPISYGDLANNSLIQLAGETIKRHYIDPNPDVVEFALIGLGPPPEFD